ncbi:MAG: 23S rRNA (guanosine(2251)-2'-O)-methyltransferase RlmB [Holosporales bacterium]|jgi:23S rRNA (guanosine2251-2'-O)-methyltransferase|nr:23S rRNA (guanosine(2251)-2'-O)-methyltransferase RlmB [Holosporales bacterium]
MIIYGMHACRAAVRARSGKIRRVYILDRKSKNTEWLDSLPQKLIQITDNIGFRKILPKGVVHQGIAIDIEEVEYGDITDLHSISDNCVIAMLDGITDSNNMGAIIRSAAAFGIRGIVISDRSTCKVNGAVAKTASGGLELVNIYLVKNLSQTLDKLKSYGFWIIALTEDGERTPEEVDLPGKICLVVGAEGTGIRRLQLEKADLTVRLKTNPEFPTLNVSNAAAIMFAQMNKSSYIFT